MKTTCCALALILSLAMAVAQSPAATVTLAAKSSWAGDGWLAPGEGGYTFLGTANNERGLAYGNGEVYLVSRSGGTNVRRLNPNSGADLGGLDVTGVSGGTFPVNVAAVGSDGAIYVSNLTTQTTTTPYKLYRWANNGAAPTVAYTGDGGLGGARLGDSLAMTGANRLAAGFGSAPAVAGANSYSILDVAGASATPVAFAGTPPNVGDFRLGITFADDTHVLGTQGGSLYRYTSFSGSTGTLIASAAIPDPAGATADRLLSYNVLNGLAILAVQSIGDSHVSLYDVTNPAAPVHLASGNATSGSLTANANGTGQLAWGAVTTNGLSATQTLYAMSTNQGIQAFDVTVTIPEPTTLAGACLTALTLAGVARRRLAC